MRLWAAVVLLLAALAGCAPVREPDLVLWHAYRDAEADALNQVVARFEAQHDGVRVEVVPVPYGAYANKISSAVPRGNGPDLFIFAQERIGGWSEGGVIQAVDDLVGAELTAELPANLVDACVFDDRLWGVPLATKTTALFYNRTALQALGGAPPETTDALIALAQRFNDPAAGRFGLVYPVDDLYFHSSWLFGFGGTIKRPDGFPRLASPENAASIEFAAHLRNTLGLIPRDADYAVAVDRFNSGNALFAINGPWFIGELDAVDFGIVPLPVVSATGTPARPFVTVESVLMTTQPTGDRRALAGELMRFLAEPESALVRARVGRQVVTHPGAYADAAIAADPVLATFAEAATRGVSMPNAPSMQAIWEPGQRAIQQVLRGDRSAADALAAADADLARALTPPPPPTDPRPWAIGFAVATVALACWVVVRARRARLAQAMWRERTAYAYIAPAAIAAILLIFVPFFVGAAISLYAYEGGEFTFVGLSNFVSILTASDRAFFEPRSFWFTLAVTVAWTLANVALHVSIGLALAMLLRDPWVRLRGVYRVLLIIPWAVPNYITALIWKSMFNFNFGAVNGLLRACGVEPIDWFSSWATAFTANLTTNTWLGFPFMMVVSLGALQSIPRDLEDAAEVDGASRWQRFAHVTFPLLKPALVPAVVLGTVWTFNMFNIIYLVSGGGPDSSTDILITEAYRWAFERGEQYGYAAAYGLLIFGVLVLYTWATTGRAAGEVADA